MMDWKKILDFLWTLATTWGIKLLAALVVLAIGAKIIGSLCKWMRRTHKLSKLDDGLRTFLESFAKIGLYALLIITVASIIGIPATSFITILASCGVAIGLALQGSLSNVAGGLMILFFKPFRIGDYIEAGGESGTVTDISVVYTVLLTPDNKRITMPNGNLTNSVIKNYSAEALRRVDLTFGAEYGSDVEKVKAVITRVAESHELVLKDPAPFVRLTECADSSLNYVVRVWCKNSDYWTVSFDLKEGVKKAFDENGIGIPFPQMDVHISNS